MNVDLNEVMRELEQRYPRELMICVQAVQIRLLQGALEDREAEETD